MSFAHTRTDAERDSGFDTTVRAVPLVLDIQASVEVMKKKKIKHEDTPWCAHTHSHQRRLCLFFSMKSNGCSLFSPISRSPSPVFRGREGGSSFARPFACVGLCVRAGGSVGRGWEVKRLCFRCSQPSGQLRGRSSKRTKTPDSNSSRGVRRPEGTLQSDT